MIYLLAAVLLLTAFQFARRARREGALRVLRDLGVAAVFGLLAGLLIGAGARAGMAAIPFANGSAPSFTAAGTAAVVLTFAGYGIGLGVIYEALFRRLLRARGLAYGLLVTLVTWYPLAQAGAQQLAGQPPFIALAAGSGLVVASMWLPFALALEALLGRWHRRGTATAKAPADT